MIPALRTRIGRALTPIRTPPVINPVVMAATRLLLLPLAYGPLRFRRFNAERVPRRGATIIVCNHVSFVDPLLVGAAMRPRNAFMMAKSELFRSKPLAWWMSRTGGFPVERATADRESLRIARNLLKDGKCLLVFPEGGVNREGILRPGFPGAGALALMPGVTVIPAAIWNTQLLRGPVRVRFGEPIPMEDIRSGPKAGRNKRASDRIMASLAALLPTVGGPVQPPPTGDPWIPAPRGDGKGIIRS